MLTRHEVEQTYTVGNGIIMTPGKFEGEPVYAPSFWEAALEGCADEDDGEIFTFELDDQDRRDWPELGDAIALQLAERSDGFVQTNLLYAPPVK